MESSRFDSLSRSFARMARRRTLVAAAFALATGAVAPTRDADARGVCRPFGFACRSHRECCSLNCPTGRLVSPTRRNRCGCPAGLTHCYTLCVDLQTAGGYCGSCSNSCETNRANNCYQGKCSCGQGPMCAEGEACVASVCTAET